MVKQNGRPPAETPTDRSSEKKRASRDSDHDGSHVDRRSLRANVSQRLLRPQPRKSTLRFT
jgi:hypothetical protein